MKPIFFYAIPLLLLTLTSAVNLPQEEFTSLLDEKLSQWEIYISYKYYGPSDGSIPKDKQGRLQTPLGYNPSHNKTFSVIEENGQQVLKVTGEYYGCVFTKKEYENYHLKLRVKWGERKWNPRLKEEKDSGILYHSTGECGVDYWGSWMQGQEFQIIENSIGDYWSIAQSQIDIASVFNDRDSIYSFDPIGTIRTFGHNSKDGNYCKAGINGQKEDNEWNTLELICYKDQSLHIVNGKVAMALKNPKQLINGQLVSVTKGKIQLQSEAAEVYFKDIQIKQIQEIPSEFASYFRK